ncbi:hypothetical protein ACHAXR_002579 [Thalassiosira sp. AJA248-18]
MANNEPADAQLVAQWITRNNGDANGVPGADSAKPAAMPGGTQRVNNEGEQAVLDFLIEGTRRHTTNNGSHFKKYRASSTAQEEPWDCECGEHMPSHLHRCRACKKWRESEHEPASCPKYANPQNTSRTYVPSDSGIEISNARKTNERGRPLCKVVGCNKLDQAKNDGFCRMHFNMFSVAEYSNGEINPNGHCIGNWSCDCGHLISDKQSRCGKCHRWRGGKRMPYNVTASKKSAVSANPVKPTNAFWTCDCGKSVGSSKSRCGSCHRWKGGKRKGGWKISSSSDNAYGGIDWDQDWTCCEQVFSASKTRCGKCNRWRGGKRRAKTSKKVTSAPAASGDNNMPVSEERKAQAENWL